MQEKNFNSECILLLKGAVAQSYYKYNNLLQNKPPPENPSLVSFITILKIIKVIIIISTIITTIATTMIDFFSNITTTSTCC